MTEQRANGIAGALSDLARLLNAIVVLEGHIIERIGQVDRRIDVLTDRLGVERVAVAIIVREQKVLLVRRRVPDGDISWQFPGGKAEPRESAAEAAVRETAEETGLRVVARRGLGDRVHPATGKLIAYVACDAAEGDARVASGREIDAAMWVPISGLGEYVPGGVFGPVREYLEAVLADRKAGS